MARAVSSRPIYNRLVLLKNRHCCSSPIIYTPESGGWLITTRITITRSTFNLKLKKEVELHVGDLVRKKCTSGNWRLAIITDISLEDYYEFNSWIRVVYTDEAGGFEWIHREGLEKLNNCS